MKENNNVAKKALNFLRNDKLILIVMIITVVLIFIKCFYYDFFIQRMYLVVMFFAFLTLSALLSLLRAIKKRRGDYWDIFIMWSLSLVAQILTFIFN